MLSIYYNFSFLNYLCFCYYLYYSIYIYIYIYIYIFIFISVLVILVLQLWIISVICHDNTCHFCVIYLILCQSHINIFFYIHSKSSYNSLLWGKRLKLQSLLTDNLLPQFVINGCDKIDSTQINYSGWFCVLQWSATGGPRAKTGPPAIISGPCPQPDYFDSGWFWNRSVMTATVTHNQSTGVERSTEWSGVILTWARSGFLKNRSVVVFTRSTTAPSRGQFMPTARNITAYLARIHMLNIFSWLDSEGSLKSERMWRQFSRNSFFPILNIFSWKHDLNKYYNTYSHAITLSIMHSNKCNLTVLLHLYPISNEQKSVRNASIRR